MLKKLVLTSLLFVASVVAYAQDFGNPVAYLENNKGGILFLTDKKDSSLCPEDSYLAVAANTPTAEPIVGCWIFTVQEGKRLIVLAWLPDYNKQAIPADMFRPVPVECDPSVHDL